MEYRGNSVIHPTLNTEERKDAFKKSTEVMKKDGALAIAQLNHVNFKICFYFKNILGREIDTN